MKTACKIIFCSLFIICLLLSIGAAACCFTFRVQSAQNTLYRSGFYEKAAEEVISCTENLQSIINIETEQITQVVSKESITPILEAYTNIISHNLLTGTDAEATLEFSSDALQQLVNDTITLEQYNGDTAAMQADREDAYAELQTEIQNTLDFFPQTLYKTVKDLAKKYGVSMESIYAAIGLVKKATIPLIIFTVLLAVAVWLCDDNHYHRLRTLSGCCAIPLSFCLFLTVVMRASPLLNRFSLADGLLKEYIRALFQNASDSILLAIAIPFGVSVITLLTAIVWEGMRTSNNTCTEEETVIQ